MCPEYVPKTVFMDEKVSEVVGGQTFTLSNATHSRNSWVPYMKGHHMVGQCADSAAGYCPSKILWGSKNIMIHLHIFFLSANQIHKHEKS